MLLFCCGYESARLVYSVSRSDVWLGVPLGGRHKPVLEGRILFQPPTADSGVAMTRVLVDLLRSYW